MDRSVCKTKINNSTEKRTSTIESVYNCNNDHNCETNYDEVNSIECPESDDQAILICAIDLIIEDQEMLNSSLITSDESMIMSPNTTIDKSMKRPKTSNLAGYHTSVEKGQRKLINNDVRQKPTNGHNKSGYS